MDVAQLAQGGRVVREMKRSETPTSRPEAGLETLALAGLPPVSKTRRSVERRLNDSALRTAVARRRPVGDSAYAKRESAGAGGADGRASDHDRLAVKQERDLVRPAVPVLLNRASMRLRYRVAGRERQSVDRCVGVPCSS